MKIYSIVFIALFVLTSCAVQTSVAPIEYNHKKERSQNSNISSNAPIASNHKKETLQSSNESTPTLNNDDEIISNDFVTSSDENSPDQDNYILPNASPKESNTRIIYHEVNVGETIEDIAIKYNQTVKEIAVLNDLRAPYYLDEFQVIKIKVAKEPNEIKKESVVLNSESSTSATESDELTKELNVLKEPKALKKESDEENKEPAKSDKESDEESKESTEESKESSELNKEPIGEEISKKDFIKPLDGKIISKFGEATSNGKNKGITIEAKQGTKILASASGKVIYADYDAIFGNLVIIKLDNNIITSYAHLEDIILSKGSSIKQGEVIGYVGNSGKTKTSQLHFAIREGKTAKDPLQYIKY